MSSDVNNNLDEHRKSVLAKRQKVKEVVEKHFPGRFTALEAGLSVMGILEIEGITLPFMLVMLGPPSAGKSTVLSMLESLPKTFSLDSFTPKAFVSHMSNKSEEMLKKIDILGQIKDKLFITSDLAAIFSIQDDDLKEIMGILTRILDGRGYKKGSGAHEARGYDKVFFVWIGATVQVSKKMWKVMSGAGPKIYFLRIGSEISLEQEQEKIIENMQGMSYDQKLEEIGLALKEYWDAVLAFPIKKDGKIVWDSARDAQSGMLKIVVSLGQLVGRLRAHVPTEDTENTGGSNYGFGTPTVEEPSRAALVLYNYARGHALGCGRNYLTEEDLHAVRSVVLSSGPDDIVDMLKFLIENNGEVTTAQMQERFGTKTTVLKAMRKLVVLGIVDEVTVPGTTKPFHGIRLKDQFRWILESKKQ